MNKLLTQNIKTRDGIYLATDIYLPSNENGPWPVIIERTPYNKDEPSRSEVNLDGSKLSRQCMADAFTEQGFVVIFQDCRGRHASTGTFIKYVHEAQDGEDTFKWIMQQTWCNGSIGTMGLSYAAHTQMAVACLNPVGLKCMLMDSGGFSSAYECGIRQGGAFELKQATWAYKQAINSPQAKASSLIKKAIEDEDLFTWFQKMPWSKGNSPLKHVPEYEAYLLEQWSKGEFDSFWQQSGIYALDKYHNIPDIPILFMSSWYDAYVKSTLSNYESLRRIKKSPMTLIMGPWLHGDRNDTFSGDVDFGDEASFDNNLGNNWLDYRINWFKRCLQENQVDENEPTDGLKDDIKIFQMGGGSGLKNTKQRLFHGGKWLSANQWPLPNTASYQLYLQPDHKLSLEKPNAEAASMSYVHDPDHPVPTVGGSLTSGGPIFFGGAFNQVESKHFFGTDGSNRPLSERADVLSFETEPLSQDISICGKVKIHLFITSDAPDTDFTAKLMDVYPASHDYPQGFAMNITDGIFRCRYRESWSKTKPLNTAEVTEITITPFETCNLFKKGHKIRLDIASSNFPKYDVNPNSGEAEGQAKSKRIAKNTIHLSQQYASYMEIEYLDQ